VWQEFWLSFLPLFVAIDPPGILPLFIGLTGEMDSGTRKQIARTAVLTAFMASVLFAVGGKILLDFLGLSIWDFSISGGILLLVLSISDLLKSQSQGSLSSPTAPQSLPKSWGAVPMGIPLIAGPAVLTSSLILAKSHGIFLVVGALFFNMVILYPLLALSDVINKKIGVTSSAVAGKIFSLLLAAIAVRLIHFGILGLIRTTP